MQLDEFVAATLEQIVAGVKTAQSAVERHGARINPVRESSPAGRTDEKTWTVIQDVEFDVALTVSETSKSGAGLRVAVPLIGGGVEGGSGRERSEVSRVKFTVPIVLPKQEYRPAAAAH